jgi:hypothetical protein
MSRVFAALFFLTSAGMAAAQSADHQQPPSQDTQTGRSTPGEYPGVDTDGNRVEVQAPYGGRNQAQADRIEAPITERLNEQALQGIPMPQQAR